ncbi:hypothetical protein M3O75_14300 [Klebsiella pneumoniae]|nr:hypothetical protein [Klebsiella pneumoniae]
MGINTSGEIVPRRGLFQRSRISTPQQRPLRASCSGWHQRANSRAEMPRLISAKTHSAGGGQPGDAGH